MNSTIRIPQVFIEKPEIKERGKALLFACASPPPPPSPKGNININSFANAFKFHFNRDNAIKNLKNNKHDLTKSLKYLA